MAALHHKLFACGLIVASLAGTAAADTYHHIDELACEISQQTKQLVHESRHYRNTPEYCNLREDTRELARLADHIHELAIHRGCIRQLEADVDALEATFHHLERIFDRAEYEASWGHGRIRGCTFHVKQLLVAIERNILCLQTDLRTLRALAFRPAPVAVPVMPVAVARPPYGGWGGYAAPPRPVQPIHPGVGPAVRPGVHPRHDPWGPRAARGRTFSFGGGSSRITFRF